MLSNHLGSVVKVVNTDDQSIVQAIEYDAWGNVLSDTNPLFQPFYYAGGLYDPETKLTRFGARDYDAEIGRWTAKDPIGFAGDLTSLYDYVGGDPINFIDPSGLYYTDGFWNGIWGGIYTITGGYTPSATTVNIATGFGDGVYSAITLGLGDLQDVRDLMNLDGGDPCSSAYRWSSVGGNIVGGVALGGSIVNPKPTRNGYWHTSHHMFGKYYRKHFQAITRFGQFRIPYGKKFIYKHGSKHYESPKPGKEHLGSYVP